MTFHAILCDFFHVTHLIIITFNRKLDELIKDDAEAYNEECSHDVDLSDDEVDAIQGIEEDENQGDAGFRV